MVNVAEELVTAPKALLITTLNWEPLSDEAVGGVV